jgi:hypothetical protein
LLIKRDSALSSHNAKFEYRWYYTNISNIRKRISKDTLFAQAADNGRYLEVPPKGIMSNKPYQMTVDLQSFARLLFFTGRNDDPEQRYADTDVPYLENCLKL